MSALKNQEIPSILIGLRNATQSCHKNLEKLSPFFNADFDRAAYLRWLDLMNGFYRGIDQAVLLSGFTAMTDWQYEPRCGLIVRDIASLDNRLPYELPDQNHILANIKKLTRTGEVAGMLYVIEGAVLGGRVLMKTLHLKAGVTATTGASFFLPYGEYPEPHWADYVKLLAQLTTNSALEEEVIYGAVTTFNTLQDWVKQGWHG
jgi:heme oxygenase